MKKLKKNLPQWITNNEISLFLDRDGVINKRIPGDYIKIWDEFEFIPGVTDAIRIFSSCFKYIFIVTNQQGIGKGLMDKAALDHIHKKMTDKIMETGGRIDKIYFCPDLANTGSLYRKPNIGMALQAKKEFSALNLTRAVMAGDTLNDMKFGKKAGMTTVLISEDHSLARNNHLIIDYCYPDLISFAESIL